MVPLNSGSFSFENEMMKLSFVPSNDVINEVLAIRILRLKKRESAHHSGGFYSSVNARGTQKYSNTSETISIAVP